MLSVLACGKLDAYQDLVGLLLRSVNVQTAICSTSVLGRVLR